MVTLASQPYQGLSNDQVLKYVIEGGVMERPENCPDEIYNLMRQTWNHKATKRPTFIDIATILMCKIDVESFERVSFYHGPDGVEARNQNNSQFFRTDKDLELVTLQELREEENEVEEDSPLRQDFGDFVMVPFSDTPKSKMNFLDLNSSKAPLKAGFDDFDGVSAGSLASSKDTLDLPFAEEGLNSVKASPYASKKSSKGNISQMSSGPSSRSGTPGATALERLSVSPQSAGRSVFLETTADEPEYANRSPEVFAMDERRDVRNSPRLSFPAIDDNETLTVVTTNPELIPPIETEIKQKTPEFKSNKTPDQQTPALNNGYIGGTTT